MTEIGQKPERYLKVPVNSERTLPERQMINTVLFSTVSHVGTRYYFESADIDMYLFDRRKEIWTAYYKEV